MSYKFIGQQIKEMRLSKRISQKEIAGKLKIDVRSYRRIETGDRKTCDLEQLITIARILGLGQIRFYQEGRLKLK